VPYSHGLGHDSNPGRASIAAAAAGLRRRAGGRLGPRPRFDRRRRRRPAAAGRRRCSGPAGDSDPGRASINATAVGLRRRAGGRLGPRPLYNRRRRRPPAAAGRRRCSGPRFDRRTPACGGGPADDSDPVRSTIAAAAAGPRRRVGDAAPGRWATRIRAALRSLPPPPACGGGPADDSDPGRASIAAARPRRRAGGRLGVLDLDPLMGLWARGCDPVAGLNRIRVAATAHPGAGPCRGRSPRA
jgi:hypothetical protein